MATFWKEPAVQQPRWKLKNRLLFGVGLLLSLAGIVGAAYGFIKDVPLEPGFWHSQGVDVLFGFLAAVIFGFMSFENRPPSI